MTDNTMHHSKKPKKEKDNIVSIGFGQRLKSAREAMNLSDKEAASRLNLHVKFVSIMENEDFENGPPATFMRGYLRSYAKILNIPENEIEAGLRSLGMQAQTTNTVVLPTKINIAPRSQDERYIRWLTYLISIVLIALVGIWWSSRPRDVVQTTIPVPAATTNANVTTAPPSPVAPSATAPNQHNAAKTNQAPATSTVNTAPAQAQTTVMPSTTTSATPSATAEPSTAAPSTTAPQAATAEAPATATTAPSTVPAPGTTLPTAAPNAALPDGTLQAPGVLPGVTPNPAQTTTTENPQDEQNHRHHYHEPSTHMHMSVPEPGLMGD